MEISGIVQISEKPPLAHRNIERAQLPVFNQSSRNRLQREFVSRQHRFDIRVKQAFALSTMLCAYERLYDR